LHDGLSAGLAVRLVTGQVVEHAQGDDSVLGSLGLAPESRIQRSLQQLQVFP